MLSRVELCSDVVTTCLSHALSTEYQEVMGLLLGHSVEPQVGHGSHGSHGTHRNVIRVTRVMVLTRKDKARDRVEVSNEDLSMASTVAEKLSEIDGTPINVVGWYHSHPHITVFPSHVDCRTQGLYQSLEAKFIGVIFSVFNKGKLDVCAFQSRNLGTHESPNWQRVEIPIVVVKTDICRLEAPIASTSTSTHSPSLASGIRTTSSTALEHLINLNYVLLNEEKLAFDAAVRQAQGLPSDDTSTIGSLTPGSLTQSDTLLLAGAYRQNLNKLLETQLLPLLSGIQCRNHSRRTEKSRLEEEIARMKKAKAEAQTVVSTSSSTTLPSQASDDNEDNHFKKLHRDNDSVLGGDSLSRFDGALSSLRLTAPHWNDVSSAVKMVTTTGIRVVSAQLERDGTLVSQVPSPCIATISPHKQSVFLSASGAVESGGAVASWIINFTSSTSSASKTSFHILQIRPGTRVTALEMLVRSTSSPTPCVLKMEIDESVETTELLKKHLQSSLRLELTPTSLSTKASDMANNST
jgi:proteasome lid subunit RPN8/RPN11